VLFRSPKNTCAVGKSRRGACLADRGARTLTLYRGYKRDADGRWRRSGLGRSLMRRESKHAVVRRLQFAAAELEVTGEIVDCEGDTVLREQVHSLTERIRDCIDSVSGGNKSNSFPSPIVPSF
jgi:hypothetical protein